MGTVRRMMNLYGIPYGESKDLRLEELGLLPWENGNEKDVSRTGRLGIGEQTYRYPGLAWC